MKIIQRYKEISMHRKNFDIVTNNIHYPIASFLCTLISFSRITPNMVTVIAILAVTGVYFLNQEQYNEVKSIYLLLLATFYFLHFMKSTVDEYKLLDEFWK